MAITNAEWCIKQGIKFKDLTCCSYTLSAEPQLVSIGCYSGDGTYYEYYRGKRLGDNLHECILAWLDMGHVEPILDDAEKRYLKGVIRPFRNEIKSIEKYKNWSNNSERIYFFTKKGELFYLKYFKLGTMYKGMEPDKEYTLEELGL